MKRQTLLAVLAAGTALNLATAAFAADRIERVQGRASARVGTIEKANELIGRNVVNRQDEKIGDVADFVVDLDSGRILYALISSGGFLGIGDTLSAVPVSMLRAGQGDNQLLLNVDKERLANAPKFNNQRAENLGNPAFVRQVYSYYGREAGWLGRGEDAKLGNVHRASDLLRAEVNNSAGERIGRISNLAADTSSGRVLYAILNPTRALDEGGYHYALPPMALTGGRDGGALTVNLNENRLASAPKFRPNNWQEITAPSYAGNVYQFYGKQLYTESDEVLPGLRADDDTRAERRAERQQDREARREAREEREERQAGRETARAGETVADNAFGPIIGAESLMGWQVQGPGGGKLGTLKDLVFDLESGRLLFGVVDQPGLGVRDNYAVAPGAFRRINEGTKTIIAEFGTRRLEDAPTVPRNRAEYIAPNYVGNVYRFYGERPWWVDRTPEPTGRDAGKFGNVQRATDMIGMNIENVNGENLGRVHNVMVDLPDGRLAYVLLAPRTQGRDADGFIALPPMAITVGGEGKTLVTNLDENKLQTAPRVTRNELSKLDDASFAANVYRFYGKDTWWRGSATGRD